MTDQHRDRDMDMERMGQPGSDEQGSENPQGTPTGGTGQGSWPGGTSAQSDVGTGDTGTGTSSNWKGQGDSPDRDSSATTNPSNDPSQQRR